jgi:uncharacterized protein (TIGR02271 family)
MPKRLPDPTEPAVPSGTLPQGNESVIPVLAEELVVEKRQVPTGGVRVHKRIDQHEEMVDVPLVKERVEIRRVLIDREIEAPVSVRREGDTTIIPIVEEVLVIEKRLRLKEEIHIIREARTERHQERVTLRREEAQIERLNEHGEAEQGNAEPGTEEPLPARRERPAKSPRVPRKSILGDR